MKKKVTQIREMDIIEKEFNNAKVGVLAYRRDNDKINQNLIRFVYIDKNIYIVFDENDENYDKIVFEDHVSFMISKDESLEVNNSLGESASLKYFFLKTLGVIKKVEDSKVVEEVLKVYYKKYSPSSEDIIIEGEKLAIIDTEEIQAVEVES